MRLRRRRSPAVHDVTCQQAVALMAAYLDHALPSLDRQRLQAHLDQCPHCAEHLKQLEVAILVAGAVRADDLDPRARADLMEVYRRWRDEEGAP